MPRWPLAASRQVGAGDLQIYAYLAGIDRPLRFETMADDIGHCSTTSAPASTSGMSMA